jgi:hypothetical protein
MFLFHPQLLWEMMGVIWDKPVELAKEPVQVVLVPQ